MGIQNRDYYRDDPPGRSYGSPTGSGLSVVGRIIAITVAVYVVQLVAGDRFTAWFDLDPDAIARGQLWRLSTYDFLHARHDVWHIVFNMYILYLTGRDLEARRGTREFVAFYLLAGIISGLVFLVWSVVLNDVHPAIGASGAVSAVMIVYALTYPHEVWRIWGIIPIPVWVIAALTIIFDLHPMLLQLSGEGFSDGVAHSAHIGGMVFGALYQQQNWRLLDWLPQGRGNWRRLFRRRPKLRVHRPQPEESNFGERVDELLDKIAQHGEASLTDDERAVLIEASRRAREKMSK